MNHKMWQSTDIKIITRRSILLCSSKCYYINNKLYMSRITLNTLNSNKKPCTYLFELYFIELPIIYEIKYNVWDQRPSFVDLDY